MSVTVKVAGLAFRSCIYVSKHPHTLQALPQLVDGGEDEMPLEPVEEEFDLTDILSEQVEEKLISKEELLQQVSVQGCGCCLPPGSQSMVQKPTQKCAYTAATPPSSTCCLFTLHMPLAYFHVMHQDSLCHSSQSGTLPTSGLLCLDEGRRGASVGCKTTVQECQKEGQEE